MTEIERLAAEALDAMRPRTRLEYDNLFYGLLMAALITWSLLDWWVGLTGGF